MPTIGKPVRILLVEEQAEVADPLERALRHAGFATTTVRSAADALALSNRSRFDLALLDLELPDGDARAACDRLHRENGLPVVMLAESLRAADRDTRLDGAEDYVIKPARAADVIARIRAVLRRTRAGAAFGVLRVGPLSVDPAERRAELGGVELPLSPKELLLLARLARDAGRVVTREQLLDDVWGPNWFGSKKTLDVHVGWLRRKLGDDPAHPRFIHNVRGVGFRLSSAQELAQSANGSGVNGSPAGAAR